MIAGTFFKCHFGCKTAQHMSACNFRRHLREQHNFTDEEMKEFNRGLVAIKADGGLVYKCDTCSHTCASKSGIRSHITRNHKKLIDPSQISLLESNEDGFNHEIASFSLVSSDCSSVEIAERVNVEKSRPSLCDENNDGNLTCPETSCNWKGRRRKDYVQHMHVHKETINIEHIRFESIEEFEVWFNLRQQLSCSSLVTRSSYQNGSKKIVHYICHQEGTYMSQATMRIGHKSRKITGEIKCVCFAEVVKNGIDGSVSVVACFQHYSHSVSVAVQILKKEEKEEIKKYIRMGMTNKQVIDFFMKNVGKESKLAFLTFDDIRRIRKTEGLLPGRFHDFDLESIKIRISENSDEGFQLYDEPVDDDGTGFRLVIISDGQKELLKKYSHRGVSLDDTFCVTRYNLKLTTVMVINGHDRALPVAFLLSHSTTADDIAALFRCLQNLYPEFQPEYFISDEANAFYNGYLMVFPNSKAKKILCRWHVIRSWRKKADGCLAEDLNELVLEKLRLLIREPGKEKLNHRLNELLHILDEHESNGARIFANYFRTYYIGRIEEWSTAFRLGSPFHTTMFNENFHAILKRDILMRKTNLRIDEFVQCLLDGYQWILHKNAKQVARNLSKACPRLAESRKICKKSKRQLLKYDIEDQGDGSYIVTKREDGSEYEVFDCASCSCEKISNVHCLDCSACPYRFRCTCLFQKSGVVCKHTHMVLRTFGSPSDEIENQNPDFFALDITDVGVDTNNEKNDGNKDDQSGNDARLLKISKIKQGFENIISSLEVLCNDKNERADTQISKVLEEVKMMEISLSNSTNSKTLETRQDYRKKEVSARKKMNGYDKLKPRSKKKKKVNEYVEDNLMSLEEIEICIHCRLRDPPLPDDIDDEEEEAQVTDWKVCQGCGIYIHLTCSFSCKSCEACGGTFMYTGDLSEDEISDKSEDEISD